MSVYKPKGSPYYHYDFQLRGRRFCGSTEKTSRREAEQVEGIRREEAKQEVKRSTQAKDSLALADVCGRYWQEIGQHGANRKTTKRDLARLVEHLGAATDLSRVGDSDVAALVAWRRGHHVVRSKKAAVRDCPHISNATVNRSTTELLRRLFSRAKKAWGTKFDNEPCWTTHMLPEAQERVRELATGEAAKLDAAMRPDYAPFFALAQATGLRLRECLLKWSEVNWDAKQIVKLGKGGKRVTAPITSAVRAILWPLRGHHAEWVFTYEPKRIRAGGAGAPRRAVAGAAAGVVQPRQPLTYSGVKTQWKRLRKRAGVVGFRFHDFRHDFGTKLLRETGNVKLVQRALNHSDIASTLRYAHVLDDEVAAAVEKVSAKRRRA